MLNAHHLKTPVGDMLAVFSARGLCLLEFAGQPRLEHELAQVRQARGSAMVWGDTLQMQALQQQLDTYFAGGLSQFDVALDSVGTPFQQTAWQTLLRIPYGRTISYLQQATLCGNAKAVRAVAAANGSNKISILIPCHRVIGSNGQLTGYGGGLERKRFLLALESTHAQEVFS